jgi:hypothetical protein
VRRKRRNGHFLSKIFLSGQHADTHDWMWMPTAVTITSTLARLHLW